MPTKAFYLNGSELANQVKKEFCEPQSSSLNRHIHTFGQVQEHSVQNRLSFLSNSQLSKNINENNSLQGIILKLPDLSFYIPKAVLRSGGFFFENTVFLPSEKISRTVLILVDKGRILLNITHSFSREEEVWVQIWKALAIQHSITMQALSRMWFTSLSKLSELPQGAAPLLCTKNIQAQGERRGVGHCKFIFQLIAH